MNKQKFVEFIRKPSALTTDDMSAIGEALKSYPYFANARIILAKGSKIKGTSDTKEKIASAAVYASDRALLKKYINDELIFLRSLEAKASAGGQLKSEAITKEKPEPLPEIPDNQDHKSKEPETKAPASTDTKAPIIKVDAPIDTADQESSDLDQLIDDLWKDVEEMRKSKARFEEIEKKIEEEDAVNKAVKKATQKSSSTSKKAPAKTTRSTTKKSTAAKKTTTRKASATTKKPAAKKSTSTASKKKSAGTKTRKSDSSDDKKGDDKKGDPKAEQAALIDHFIKLNPGMPSANDRNKVSADDLSESSIQLNPEVASEYLAEIFLEQGKVERAVQIYEALMVKFPENSIYFAEIIKKLKN